jgi:hypothetical protein
MKTLKQADILDTKITALKLRRDIEFMELKQYYLVVQQSFTIANIVHKGISEFYNTTTNKNNLLSTVTSVLGGYLFKKIVVGDSSNPLKQVLGYGIQFAVTKLLSKFTNK